MGTDNQMTVPVSEERISSLLQAMTTAEKVSLLSGASMWRTAPIERLGIPAIQVSDGPNGARGSGPLVGGTTTAACFPVGISLAATWNTALLERVGEALAEEAKSKGAHLLLAPSRPGRSNARSTAGRTSQARCITAPRCPRSTRTARC